MKINLHVLMMHPKLFVYVCGESGDSAFARAKPSDQRDPVARR
ncbi:hypothetical protein [Novosphingobium sp. CECT 9465]|nr:hypothetical protein [Novosphingobium sp. CECT 9465]